MSAEIERLSAAQAKADEVIRAVAEAPDGEDLIRLSATDVQTGQRLATGFVNYRSDGAPAVGQGVAAERELLAAVLEALTLPFDVDDYDRRILERAACARITLKGVLDEGDPAGNADWLRRKLREEEASR